MEHNHALLQADLDQIRSFLISTEPIQPENLFASFFAYKIKCKSTQTQDEDINTTDSTQRLNQVRKK